MDGAYHRDRTNFREPRVNVSVYYLEHDSKQHSPHLRVQEIQMLPRNHFSRLEQVRGGSFTGERLYQSAPNNALTTDRMQM